MLIIEYFMKTGLHKIFNDSTGSSSTFNTQFSRDKTHNLMTLPVGTFGNLPGDPMSKD